MRSPFIVRDASQFEELMRTFRTQLVLVYVNPKDKESYDKVLKNLIELRHKSLKIDDDMDGEKALQKA